MKTLLLITLLLTTIQVSAQTVKIGNSTYGSLTAAITAASNGDIIDVTGTWTEPITINKNITLRGSDPTTDIIQASSTVGDTGADITIRVGSAATDVTIENLTVENGYSTDKGAGIFSDKATNLTLNNLVIQNNTAIGDGGGVFLAGTNATITGCTLQGNSTTGKGGGIAAVPNNAMTDNTTVNIYETLIYNNTASDNGGGFFISGNNGFGDQYFINVTMENVTIYQNEALLGAIGYVFGCDIVANSVGNAVGDNNVSLTMTHVTAADNNATDTGTPIKGGLFFLKDVSVVDGAAFNLYNSMVLMEEDITIKAVNFANTTKANVVNNYLGGLNAIGSVATNDGNTTGRKLSNAGVSSSLSDLGGNVEVLTMNWGSALINAASSSYTTVNSGDALGVSRGSSPDIGAYEYPIVELNGTFYETITEAITAAVATDVINITGTHTASITIDKDIEINGTNAATDIIQAHQDYKSASDRVVLISGVSDVKLSNVTIKNGNNTDKGGGIFIEESIGEVLLEKVTVEDNYSTKNGGGVAIAGSDVIFNDVTIQNNTTEENGGGVFMTPKNFTGGANITVTFDRCLLNGNTAQALGGGFTVDGFNSFGDEYTLDVTLQNSTIFNNTAQSGAIGFVKGVDLVSTGDNNVSLTMNHMTIAYNQIDNLTQQNFAGLYFLNGAGTGNEVPFTLINSILVNADDVTYKALNFKDASVSSTSVVKNILGGLVNKPADVTDNTVGRNASYVMVANALSDIGAESLVLELDGSSPALSAGGSTGGNDTDILGQTRDSNPDLGVYQVTAYNESLDLPVELMYFTAERSSNGIQLNWETALEINNSYFEVQKSFTPSMSSFETIATVEGHGNTSTNIKYEVIDEDQSTQTVYYRLKQVDYDGAYTYFYANTAGASTSNSIDFTVYPNPVASNENLNIVVNKVDQTEYSFELIDLKGKVIHRFIKEDGKGDVVQFQMPSLQAGIYLIKLQSGKESIIKKVIIK